MRQLNVKEELLGMKQLLLTFFAFILCFSLFFDDESESLDVEKLNYIYEDGYPERYFTENTLNYDPLYIG